MGKKGGARRLKRMPAPTFWPIPTKKFQWAVKPKPGPHPQQMCLPLIVILRDVLGYVKTAREAEIALSEGKIRVDGKIRRDGKYPVGLMDVVSIPAAKSNFRVLPSPGKGLTLIKIPEEEATFKLCKIKDKTTVKGGNIQLNLHDGRNLLIKVEDPRSSVEDVYNTGDVVQINLPDQKILKHIKFAEGAFALVAAGKNMGKNGKITKIERAGRAGEVTVTIEDASGRTFQTIADYVFVTGEDKPLIRLEES
jgi:small subunit ribosomal protein S4e